MSPNPSARSNPIVQLDGILDADPVGDGVQWSLDAAEDLNVNLVRRHPGSLLAAHTNYELDVVIVVVFGSGTLQIDGTDHDLTPHVVALAAKGTERSITAGPEGLSYLTVHVRRGAMGIRPSRTRTADLSDRGHDFETRRT